MYTALLRPAVADPNPNRTVPLLPRRAEPELKTSLPLDPVLPVFSLITVMHPLLDAVPSPPNRILLPPVRHIA